MDGAGIEDRRIKTLGLLLTSTVFGSTLEPSAKSITILMIGTTTIIVSCCYKDEEHKDYGAGYPQRADH